MGVILSSDYHKMIRKMKKKIWVGHLIWGLILCLFIGYECFIRVERDLFTEAYSMVKGELGNLQAKHKILSLLRTHSLSVGQGLDIADVIIRQREIPIPIILGIMEVESNFNPNAISGKGARGLLQIMPVTAKIYAGDLHKNIHDPIANIMASVAFLTDLKKTYGENWPKVLRAYNGGPSNSNNKALDGYVRAVLTKSKNYVNIIKQ